MDKKHIGALLDELGDMLEIRGENPFKVQAYRRAARVVGSLERPLDELTRSGELRSLKGIGAAMAEHIATLVRTGDLPFYRELQEALPPGLMEILKIPGLGPRKVRRIHEELGIATVGELEYACQENRLLTLEGFGARSQEKVQEGIRRWKRYQGRYLLSDAWPAARELVSELAGLPEVEQVEVAGGLRRWAETVRDIDLVVATTQPEAVTAAIFEHSRFAEVVDKAPGASSIRLDNGLAVNLHCVARERFPFALAHYTGSTEHHAALIDRAEKRGWRLNEFGLFAGEERLPCADEAQIYRRLGLEYVAPELREDRGEIEAAQQGTLPTLIEEAHLRGVLHVHTTASDGSASLAEMVEAARGYGWSYLGVCDHSHSARYANGLDAARVREQWAQIDAFNADARDFHVFKGIESDILADGSLDYDDEILAGFDFVVASIHSRFGLPRREQTARLIRAIENPRTTMIGHLTGRLLLAREGYELDQEEIIAAAARHGVMFELNANPRRLDLDWRMLKKAREAGVMISINPDAHSVAGLAHTRFGVGIARKGWLEARDVVNSRTAAQAAELLQARKAKT